MNGVEEAHKNKITTQPTKHIDHIKQDVGVRRGRREWRRLENKKNGDEPE